MKPFHTRRVKDAAPYLLTLALAALALPCAALPLGLRLAARRAAVEAQSRAETDEERAWRTYAPDTAFEIDLSLIATNTYSLNLAYLGYPWSGTSKIDWGDGTVITNATAGYWGTTYTHTYPAIGKYVLRLGAVPNPLYGFNASSPSKLAVTRVLRFADADQNKSTSAAKRMPTFSGCPNLRAFDDGTLARWPSGYGAIGDVYLQCTSLAATSLPEWPESVTSIGRVYLECKGIAATSLPEWPAGATSIGEVYQECRGITATRIPEWPAGATTIGGTYNNCTSLTATSLPEWPAGAKYIGNAFGSTYNNCKGITATRIPDWPEGVLEIYAVYVGCSNIKGTIPPWPDSVTTLVGTYSSGVYSGCSGLTGPIPAWPDKITNTRSTYFGCTGLTGPIPAWPDKMTNVDSCYAYCSGLSGSVPEWGANIANANYTYSGCSGLSGSVPEWGANIATANNTYSYCSGLSGAWTDDAALLMPTNITTHGNCVWAASAALRALFYSDWGGTRTKPADE